MFVSFLIPMLLAGSPTINAIDPPEIPGKIVFYRTASVAGVFSGCPIRYLGREIVELSRGQFAEAEVRAGRYVLANKVSSIEVAVDPGETRYVLCNMKMGNPELQIADVAMFTKHQANLVSKELSSALAR